MKHTSKLKSTLTLFLGLTSMAVAEYDVKVSGQVRERSTYSTQAGTLKNSGFQAGFTDGNDKHELRSRIAVEAETSEATTVRIEIQDSRTFGSEAQGVGGVPHTSPIGNSKNVDLHQAYFVLGLGDWKAKLGRQKIALGTQRMVSSLEWHPNARVFDGLRLDGQVGPGTLTAMTALTSDAGKKAYTALNGLFYAMKFDKTLVDVYSFYDKNTQPAAGLKNWDLVYLGERVKLPFGDFFVEEEFIYQMGEVYTGMESFKSSAFYLATRLGMKAGKHTFSLGYDVMSGDDGEDDVFNVYMNNYTFAHAYFGWMDYVIVNKAHTTGGVADIRLDADLALNESTTLKLQGHYFTPATSIEGMDDPYGTEIDAEIHGKWFAKSKIVIGAATFIPNSDRYDDGKAAYSFYFMPIVNF